jgi:hypothetical protein
MFALSEVVDASQAAANRLPEMQKPILEFAKGEQVPKEEITFPHGRTNNK